MKEEHGEVDTTWLYGHALAMQHMVKRLISIYMSDDEIANDFKQWITDDAQKCAVGRREGGIGSRSSFEDR